MKRVKGRSVLEKVFRDPVHGDILVPSKLVGFMDTPEFQRLRGVRMLGTAYLVYPGAVHTRFEHSLGTYWLARRLLETLREVQGVTPSGEERLVVLASALLHDVTHIPYGHTFEDERRVFDRHDTPDRIRRFLPRGELGRRLRRAGILEAVLGILTETTEVPWHYEVFSGTVCADLLDYLARDAYFCGLSQRYDSRVFRAFRISAQGEIYLEACKAGLLRQDVISEVVNLLRLRYFLSERVYFHHTKTASGAMISRAVEQAVEQGLTLERLSALTDERLLAMLEERFGGDPVVGNLMMHFRSHQIYKRVYVLTRKIGEDRRRNFVERFHYDAVERRQVEDQLVSRLKMRPGELIVYCPALGMQLKEADVRVQVGQGSPRLLSGLSLPEIGVLRERHQDLWKFYVFVAPGRMRYARRISDACEELFGESNHLPQLQSGQLYLGF